ncbi:Adenosylmethionine-8-amino-7-oxononanoate aminotransferase [Fundidesulfovibrio magnetotacticus]|uniref:Multifunctional fusion protein n=1 Tax=Fundidesulfovibrio magnetotacticus TaxID=2730080 RepID=A0A6V8LLB8_9BACT|nr:adenosylmethionine--8-amino-7-oxononanoate transaminase [Fundidesulfovibrio magnetotacticus]GFK92494.1 Adenosylmethionine-8-amino-7-oxononanoate aminotransferase [Fundidesulfovibrio magnetotacticus]
MNGYFVTGTDTGVGKTVLSALLCRALGADYFKPFQTGQDSDTSEAARLAGLGPERLHPPACVLPAPLAPSQAAELAGVRLDIHQVRLPGTARPLVVEGAGGALVPVAPGQDMAALMARLGLPVLVAARSGLGTINHTLLTLEALRLRGIEVAGVALIGEPDARNRRDIEKLGRVRVVLELPRLDPLTPEALAPWAARLELPVTVRADGALVRSRDDGVVDAAMPAPGLPEPDDRQTRAPGPDVLEMDRRHVWHPFTQAGTAPPPMQALRGQGARLFTADGRELLDMVSSWWVTCHGHAHPAVVRAVAGQAARLEQALFADFTHEPAARLALALAEALPGGLTRVFFSDNGSTAVEAALKMAHQYWRNEGRPERRRFAALQGGYHGDTVGAMSAGYSSGFYAGFEPLLFPVDHLPFPATWAGDPDADEKESQALAVAENYFAVHAGNVAGVILEPLVQGASGMRMARPGFVKAFSEMARRAGALVVYDEVMTGFGRTGTLFACEQVGFAPDIVCLAKGLTAGFLPMAVTVTTEAVYQGFSGQTFDRAFAHGHSFTANPLGCAAALAGLDLFREEGTLARIKALEAVHAQRLLALAGRPGLARPRWRGAIGAVDVTGSGVGYEAAVGRRVKAFFLERGFYVRPLGDVFYLMPPACLAPAELHRAYDTLEDALKTLD